MSRFFAKSTTTTTTLNTVTTATTPTTATITNTSTTPTTATTATTTTIFIFIKSYATNIRLAHHRRPCKRCGLTKKKAGTHAAMSRRHITMCNLVQIRFCHIYVNNTRECEFAVRNDGITTSSPFLNDTKIASF